MFMMDLRLAHLNGRSLRLDCRRSHLLLYLQHYSIDICCLQETCFDSNFHEGILSRDDLSFSAYFDCHFRGVVALYGFPAKAGNSFVCFGAKPDKGFLDLKSRRTRKWYGDANESWRLDSREANSRGWRGSTDRGSQHQTPEQRGEAAWDRVQRK